MKIANFFFFSFLLWRKLKIDHQFFFFLLHPQKHTPEQKFVFSLELSANQFEKNLVFRAFNWNSCNRNDSLSQAWTKFTVWITHYTSINIFKSVLLVVRFSEVADKFVTLTAFDKFFPYFCIHCMTILTCGRIVQ